MEDEITRLQQELVLRGQEEKKQEEMSEMKSKISKLDDEKDSLQDSYQRAQRKIKQLEESLETKKKEIMKISLQTDQLRLKDTQTH